MKKPPILQLNASLQASIAFGHQGLHPSLAESIQFSEGGVRRIHDGQDYSVQMDESDLVFATKLGEGASSSVFKALLIRENGKNMLVPSFVAVKKLNNLSENLREQMKKDVRTLMDAQHAKQSAEESSGVVSFQGAYMFNSRQQVAIVLEYMNGGSLEDILKQVGTFPEAVLAQVTWMVLKGLFFLHKQLHIVHRDIKPANILMDRAGIAKIADFGISRNLASSVAMCATYQGTAKYMSPERINAEAYGFASDIWSLGLTLVECATGKFPYDASAPMRLMADIDRVDPIPVANSKLSPEFCDFCRRCLTRDPAQRASALDLISHRWLLKHRAAPPDIAAFMRSAVDPQRDLDDMSFFFVHQFHQLLNQALKDDGVDQANVVGVAAALFQPDCTSAFRVSAGTSIRAKGVARIRDHLTDLGRKLLDIGMSKFVLKSVDASACTDAGGGVALHVHGTVRGAISSCPFAQMIMLVRTDNGRYCIAHHAIAILD